MVDADYVAVCDPSVLLIPQYDILPVRVGATFVVNCRWSAAQLEAYLPTELKRSIASKRVRLLAIDATALSAHSGCTPEALLTALFWPLCHGLEAEVPERLREVVSDATLCPTSHFATNGDKRAR